MSEGSSTAEAPKFGLEETFAGGKVRVYSTSKRRSIRTEIDTIDGQLIIIRNMRPYAEDHGRVLIQKGGQESEILQIRNPRKGTREYDFYSGDELIGKAEGGLFDLLIAQIVVEGMDHDLEHRALGSKVDTKVIKVIGQAIARQSMPQN